MGLRDKKIPNFKNFAIKKIKIAEKIRTKFQNIDQRLSQLEKSKKLISEMEKSGGKLEKRITNLEKAVHTATTFDQSASRECLLSTAQNLSSDSAKISILRHLFRLRNFGSATKIADSLNAANLSPRDLFIVLRCYLSSTKGIRADAMLERFLNSYELTTLQEAEQRTLAELIYLSGTESNLKLDRLNQLINIAAGTKARQHIRFQEFRIRLEIESDIDILDFAELDNLNIEEPSSQLRYIPHLKAMGYITEARALLTQLCQHHGYHRPEIICAALALDKDWPEIDINELFPHHLDRLDILQLANEHKTSSDKFALLFEKSLQATLDTYSSKDIYQKERILNKLLRLDLLEEIDTLLSKDLHLPNTVLTPSLAAGLQYFTTNDFFSARDLFIEALEEDPSDPIAAQGLRMALPRTGGDMTSIFNIRDRLGYGIASAGRTGCHVATGADKTFGLLMSGRFYKEGFYSKRYASHWQLLKRIYGDRYLNCERLPADGAGKSLFVIGDDGVGDEVRTAQFYGHLAQRFENVTITCDPRLTQMFQRSFPDITFIPVERYRKGIVKNVTTKKERISRLNLKLSQYLTDDCKPAMDTADYITNGQNLFFNRFIGEIPRPDKGGYLNATARPSQSKKIKIGILWRSHYLVMWRKFMYLKVEDFAPLTELENVELWSMQHCISEEEKEYCRKNNIKLVEDIDMFDDFEGMAPILKNLDLMIGISSLPMELAAAVGTPAWMLGFSPENYYLRSAGGTTEKDQLTMNSTIIAPEWIDFSATTAECIALTMAETCRRLRTFKADERIKQQHTTHLQ